MFSKIGYINGRIKCQHLDNELILPVDKGQVVFNGQLINSARQLWMKWTGKTYYEPNKVFVEVNGEFIPLRTFQARAIPAPAPAPTPMTTTATQTNMDEYAPCPTAEQMEFIRQLQQANEQLQQANNEKDEIIRRLDTTNQLLRQQLDTPPNTPPASPLHAESASVVEATPRARATRDTKLKPRSQICMKWQRGELCREHTCWYAHGPQFLGTMPSPQGKCALFRHNACPNQAGECRYRHIL